MWVFFYEIGNPFFSVSFSVKPWIQVQLGSDLDPDNNFCGSETLYLTRMNLECGVCGGQPRHVLPPAPQLVRDLRGEGGDVAHAI